MEQRQRFQIDYQLNKKELREMSFRITMRQLSRRKPFIFFEAIWLVINTILLFIDVSEGRNWMSSLFFRVFPVLLIFMLMLVPRYLSAYKNMIKNGMLNAGRLSLENGYVKIGKTNAFISPASNYTIIIKGRTVLLLGQKLTNETISYVAVTRRAFASDEELDSFVAALQHSTVQEDGVLDEQEVNRECDIKLTFEVTQEQWFRIHKGMIWILDSTLSFKIMRSFHITAGASVLFVVTMAVIMYTDGYNRVRATNMLVVLTLTMVAFIISRNFKKPDEKYERWIKKGYMQTESIGEWEVGIYADGCYTYHNGVFLHQRWSDYCRCYETNDTVYFFDKSMKGYLFIPKEFLGGEEEQERFFDYFRQLKMEFTKVNL